MPSMWLSSVYEQSGNIVPVGLRELLPRVFYNDGVALTDDEIAWMTGRVMHYEQDKGQPLPDLTAHSSCWFISDRLRSIIEDFEPGRHQIIPINLKDYPDRKDYPVPYFLLVIHQTADCVIPSQTSIIKGFGVIDSGRKSRQGLDIDAITGLHLWRDPLYPLYPFTSDELREAMLENRLVGMQFLPCDLYRRIGGIFQPVVEEV